MNSSTTHNVQKAVTHAHSGHMTSKHCAVISKGSAVVSLGVNVNIYAHNTYSIHAEENAIHNLIKVVQ